MLGVRDGKRLGFWRNLIGQSEKWTILRGSAATHGQGRAQVEDTSSRGRVVHIGDPILLQAGPLLSCEQTTSVLSLSELLLTLHEGVDGVSPRLVAKDSVNFGSETWILESFGSPPLPMFFNRPYLRYHLFLLHCTSIVLG